MDVDLLINAFDLMATFTFALLGARVAGLVVVLVRELSIAFDSYLPRVRKQ